MMVKTFELRHESNRLPPAAIRSDVYDTLSFTVA